MESIYGYGLVFVLLFLYLTLAELCECQLTKIDKYLPPIYKIHIIFVHETQIKHYSKNILSATFSKKPLLYTNLIQLPSINSSIPGI